MIKYIASGRATATLADAVGQADEHENTFGQRPENVRAAKARALLPAGPAAAAAGPVEATDRQLLATTCRWANCGELFDDLATLREVLASPELGSRSALRYRCSLNLDVEPAASQNMSECRPIGWLEGDAGPRDVPTTKAAADAVPADSALASRNASEPSLVSR